MKEKLYSTKQAATALGMKRSKLYRLLKRGIVKPAYTHPYVLTDENLQEIVKIMAIVDQVRGRATI